MKMSVRAVTGRFAPSPTGVLHLGNLRTALASWLSVRSQNGRWLIRMEDVDRPRCKQAWADQQLRDLESLGLVSDLPVVYQSQREAAYIQALQTLEDKCRIYSCACTRRDLALLASAPHAEDGMRPYPGHCRKRPMEGEAQKSLRLRLPEGIVHWNDLCLGHQQDDPALLTGDPLLHRRDGCFAYHLAVVVDDMAQEVTEIVRGLDLRGVTATQIRLRELLDPGYPNSVPFSVHPACNYPVYAHLALVQTGGKRLGKRDGALGVQSLMERGIHPEDILGHLGHSLGCLDKPEACRAEDLIPHFSWDRTQTPERHHALETWIECL